MFGAIRIVFWGLIFIIGFILITKSKLLHKRNNITILLIICICFSTLTCFIPIEDKFITFSTPESAFEYFCNDKATFVVNGKNTDFVIAEKSDTSVITIIPKADNGWKLGLGINTKIVIKKITDNSSIHVYQYKNTDNYYIEVIVFESGNFQLSDNRNSEFYYITKTMSSSGEIYYTYYAYVDKFNDKYVLNVNGNEITFIDNAGDSSMS